MLFVALLTIAAVAIAPSIAFQVRRDREQELIHRGVQYSRAVRHYYKKFNRYPSKIEDLESTNNIRFLRKRYKDPITGADFKVLHLSEVQAALAGAPVAGVNTPPVQGASSGSSFGSGGFGSSASASSSQSVAATSPSGSDSATTGSSPQSAFGSPGSGSNSSPSSPSGSSPSGSASSNSNPTFGGGPIAGVVSTSKLESIREFNKKNHYNEWLFIYNPNSDTGGLLSTPSQPPLNGAIPVGLPGTTGAPGTTGSGFGNQGLGNQTSPLGGGMQQTPQTLQPQAPPAQQ
jgi:type II secretory pathway pseudopilin PulG